MDPSIARTRALPTPAIPTLAPDESQQLELRLVSPSASSRRTAPTTPPPTPTSSFVDEYSTPLMLHELTRAKLERAASGQMSGRRGAPSLRQIVLLSNVFGAASRPSGSLEQEAREKESLELDRRRKQDEERWLDTLLEQMLEVDDDDDSDDYVQVSFRGHSMGDSGYLEDSREQHPVRSEPLAAINEEELDCRDPRTSEAACDDGTSDADHDGPAPNTVSRPHSPPLPCRSPPISLPDRPTRIGSYIIDDTEPDFDSSSPPDVPPPLIEDCSPPSPGMSSLSLSGTSADSAEPDLEEERDRWLATRGTTRAGILSVDSSASYSAKPSAGTLEIVYPPTHTSFAPPSTVAREPPTPYYADSLATLPSAGSLAGALVRQQTIIFPPASTSSWTPRPPRSLSVPATPRRQLPRTLDSSSDPCPMHPTFHGGVVKSYYDFVDFGGSTSEQLPAPADPARSRGRDDLALVLASAPLPRFGSGGYRGVGWRSRSLSPDRRGRRDWARLGDVVDDGVASDP